MNRQKQFLKYLKEELTIFDIVATIVYNQVNEQFETNEEIVYKKHDTKQYVSVSKHFEQDRKNRVWWKSYKDPNFTTFVDKALTILQNLYKRKLDVIHKIKKAEDNPHIKGLKFIEREEFAFFTPDKSKVMLVSLRLTGGNYATSFSIITALNTDSSDIKTGSVYGIDANHQKIINGYTLVESREIKGKVIHFIEMV